MPSTPREAEDEVVVPLLDEGFSANRPTDQRPGSTHLPESAGLPESAHPPESPASQKKPPNAENKKSSAQSRVILRCKWRHESLHFPFTTAEFKVATLKDLKQIIQDQLDIPCDRQRFLNLDKSYSGPVSDLSLLKDCSANATKDGFLLLLGTPAAEQLPVEVEESQRLHAGDQLIYDSAEAQKLVYKLLAIERNVVCLAAATEGTEIRLIRSPRPGKKLLVLDIDYTIYDCKGASKGYPTELLKRPYLEQFLNLIHPHYDLVIWSQTRWQWVEAKCTELGLLTHPFIGPCFTLDRSSMVNLQLPAETKLTYSKKARREAEVKALQILWSKNINNWRSSNTLIVDDLPRNFMLNPLNGVPVRPYTKDLHAVDKELLLLGHYLVQVASVEDVTTMNHSQWKQYMKTTLRLDEFNVSRLGT
eukprot:Gregarina_sp_Pseudo_9__1664@NODE_211_length_3603_cov_39_818743_g196_i0_p1_GENE_NODE_211_length_3603_cov_39_818743_g196_i0NODE_211_length_3603_cov_39_818743_g196_i0_p1_ORF_typecomplete_len419_score53_01NIF/PF03031_18/4_8e03NIF/PF03031_18/2_5e26Blt1/PF12754_7/0_00041ubiquitin/PF00240_23/0_0056ubiquitin/PF00240_23/2_1e03_NODE_211_length_3603_cov_39_818743_g196_i010822338